MMTTGANKRRLSSKWYYLLGGLLFHKVCICFRVNSILLLSVSHGIMELPHHPQVGVFKDEKWQLHFLASTVDSTMPVEAEG